MKALLAVALGAATLVDAALARGGDVAPVKNGVDIEASPASAASASGSASASTSEEEYRRLSREGLDEFDRQNFEEALVLFEQAYRAQPSARALRAIAKCLFELKRYVRAVATIDRALADRTNPLGEGLTRDVIELRARALRFTGAVRIVVPESTANRSLSLSIDHQPAPASWRQQPIRLELGPHTFELQTGEGITRATLVVAGGTTQDLVLAPPAPLAERNESHALPYVAGTALIAATGGVIGAGLWLVDRNRAVSLCETEASQGGYCSNGSSVAHERDAARVVTVGSAALVVASAVTLIVSLTSSRARSAKTALTGPVWLRASF